MLEVLHNEATGENVWRRGDLYSGRNNVREYIPCHGGEPGGRSGCTETFGGEMSGLFLSRPQPPNPTPCSSC